MPAARSVRAMLMPSRAGRSALLVAVVVTAFFLSGCVSGSGGKVWLSDTCDFLCGETVINAENRVQYVKVTGAITFDGEPVLYDELVRLSYTTGTRRDGEGAPLMWSVVLNRERILKSVGRGALSLDVLIPKVNEAYVWDGSAAALEMSNTPDYPSLHFRWIDDATAPRILETYETASYFQRSDARIRVTEPLRFTRIEPTPAIEALSDAQAKNTLVPAQVWSRFGAPVALYPVPREIWSKVPDVAAFITHHATPERTLLLERDLTHKLFWWPVKPSLLDAVPVSCSALGTRCTPRLNDRGYSLAYSHSVWRGAPRALQLDFGQGVVPLATGESIYDPQTETIYMAPQLL